jgi:DNA-binding CsgD family transcriptional regulator
VELGAQPFADRCIRDFKRLGAQPPATETTEVDGPAGRSPAALTAQEQRIARLAADGMTNQQIAHAVFVSSKTIEYHLGNAFAKLGIASRHQLRAVLDALPGATEPHAAEPHAAQAAGESAAPDVGAGAEIVAWRVGMR